VGVPFVASPNHGGRIEPSLIVVHDTSDRLKPDDTISWFSNPQSKVSAHFVVARDGSVTQMVPCDRAAWHAGKSSWKGRSGCNNFAIGIEIDNPGKLTRVGDHAVAWFGEKYPLAQCVEMTTPAHGRGWWLRYTEAQLETVRELIKALLAAYPTITDVASHWEISPGRKVDTGPHFPLDDMKALLSDRRVLSWKDIRDAQERLDALGYWPGPVDGIIGMKTRAAIRSFQEQNGLPMYTDAISRPDGGLDRQTWELLFSDAAKPAPTGTNAGAAVAAAAGSRGDANLLIKGSILTSGITIADAIRRASEALDQAEAVQRVSTRSVDLALWLLTPKGLGTLVTLAACFGGIWLARRIIKRTAAVAPQPAQ